MRLSAVLLVLSLTLGCNDEDILGDQAPPLQRDVQATTSQTFNPPNVTILEGGTVRFIFGTLAHNVIFTDVPGAPTDIEDSPSSQTRSVEFPTAGTFPYTCNLHEGMNGTVVVAEPEN